MKPIEVRIVIILMNHQVAILLGEAEKSQLSWKEHLNHVPGKTIWKSRDTFKQDCQWYMDHEFVTLLVERGRHSIQGPRDVSPFNKLQMAMDSVSWCLFWEGRHEFDSFLGFQADHIRYLLGWLTQDEENAFKVKYDAVSVGMTDRKQKSQHYSVSKALSGFLRHSKKRHLFNSSGTVNLVNTFVELDRNNPIQLQMSAQDVAALLLANDKGRFQVEIIVKWSWKPFAVPPNQPWDLRIGACQGHTNQVTDPYAIHHALTFEESQCLGCIFHVTSASNR